MAPPYVTDRCDPDAAAYAEASRGIPLVEEELDLVEGEVGDDNLVDVRGEDPPAVVLGPREQR
jgi:hypothetical protein